MATYTTERIDLSTYQEERINGIDINTCMQERAVCDIMKDAIAVGDKTKVGLPCPNFVHALGVLFPRGKGHVGWPGRLKIIKKSISANRNGILTRSKLSFLKLSHTENRLSDGMIRLTTDSGLHACNVQKDYSEFRTLASTIDPAKRNKKNTTFFPPSGQSIVITKSILRDVLGFPIEYISSITDGNICRITMKIDGIDEITIERTIDREEHIGPPNTNYCLGNNEKNIVINQLCNNDPRREIDKYVLIKELGDVLQVVLAFVMKTLTPSDMTDVVGTTDDIVRSLCEFFKLSCIYQDHEKCETGEHSVFYGKVEEDPAKLIRGTNELFKKNILAHNNRLIEILSFCIGNHTIFIMDTNYLEDMKYRKLFPGIQAFLRVMIESITFANTNIMDSDVSVSIDDFKRAVMPYQAVYVVNEKLKVNQAARRLFPKGVMEVRDPIFREKKALPQIIQRPPTIQANQRGGMQSVPSPEDYVIMDSCPMEYEVTHAFLLNVQSLFKPFGGYLSVEDGADTLYITPYDVLTLLYNGLIYVGITPFNPNILQILIEKFVLTGGEYSLQEFDEVYSSIHVPLHPATIFPYTALPSHLAVSETQFTRVKYDPKNDSIDAKRIEAAWDMIPETMVEAVSDNDSVRTPFDETYETYRYYNAANKKIRNRNTIRKKGNIYKQGLATGKQSINTRRNKYAEQIRRQRRAEQSTRRTGIVPGEERIDEYQILGYGGARGRVRRRNKRTRRH